MSGAGSPGLGLNTPPPTGPPPACFCGQPGVCRQTKKQNANHGRWFWTCNRASKCKFFQWCDEAPRHSPSAAGPSSYTSPQRAQRPQGQYASPGGQQAAYGSPYGQQQGQHSMPHSAQHGQQAAYGSPYAAHSLQLHSPPAGGVVDMTGPEWRDGDPPPGPSGGARFQGPGAASPDPASPPSRRMPASFAGSPLQQTPSRAFNSPSAAGLGSPAKTGEAVTVTLAATTPGSFSASAKYHKGLIDLYKTMLSRAWDPEMRAWTFAVEERAQLVEKLHNAPFPVRIEDNVAEGAVRLSQVEAEAAEDTLPAAEVEGRISDNIGPDIWNKLFKFQQAGVRICVRRRARCMIADEMGLGKTVQAICVASCFPESWPLLIVCPSSVRLVWLEALLNWLPPKLLPAPDNLVVISSSKDIEKKLQLSADPEKKSAVIVSYELVQKLDRYAYRYPFVICDESHALKSRESNRTKFVSGLVRHVRHAVLITGTPLLSKPVELFAQIDMLRPGMFGDWDAFGQRYCGGKKTRAAPNAPLDYRGASNLVELNAILERSLMIRRLKKDVLQDLPPKQRCSVPITMDPAFLKDVEAINQELAKLDRNPGGKSSDVLDVERQQLINQLYTASGPAKVKEAWDHITNILERDEKVLVFAHHVAVLDMLADACATTRPAPTRFVRIDGSVGDGKRNEAVNQFQNDPRIRLALLSITAAGVGITLTAASVVVFAELFWNPGHLIQAEDRAHRLGQAGSIQVHYLLAPGSIDDIIWRTVQKKLQVVGRALDGNMAGTATGLNVTDTAAIERYADLAARSHLDNLGTPADPNGPSTSRTAAPDGQAHRNAPAGPDSARRFSTGVFGDDAEMDDWDAAVLSSQEVERVSQSQQQARQQAPPPQPAAELPEVQPFWSPYGQHAASASTRPGPSQSNLTPSTAKATQQARFAQETPARSGERAAAAADSQGHAQAAPGAAAGRSGSDGTAGPSSQGIAQEPVIDLSQSPTRGDNGLNSSQPRQPTQGSQAPLGSGGQRPSQPDAVNQGLGAGGSSLGGSGCGATLAFPGRHSVRPDQGVGSSRPDQGRLGSQGHLVSHSSREDLPLGAAHDEGLLGSQGQSGSVAAEAVVDLSQEPEEPPASGGGAQRRKRGRSPEATPPARPWSAAGPVESADVIELD